MDKRRLARQILFTLMMPVTGYCAYPTVEEAQALFATKLMNSTNVCMTGAYADFRCRLSQPAPAETRHTVESVVIDAITSIVVHVSTNIVDDSVGIGILEDRGGYFNAMGYSLTVFKTNAMECVRLAEYIGSVNDTDFPSDLARCRGGAMRMFLSTNKTEMAQWREREEALQRIRIRSLAEKKNLQRRVLEANRSVRKYRRSLFSLCGQSVAGCRRIMSDEEFASFTNAVVTASRANDEEQKDLFWQLHHGNRGSACLLQSETLAHSPDEEMSEFLAILSRHEAHDAALVIAARLGMINEIVSMATEIATNGIPFSEGVRRAVR